MSKKTTFRCGIFIALNIVLLSFSAVEAAVQNQSIKTKRQVAITIDDLPFAGGAQDIETVRETNRKILLSLKAHHAPAAGFVIETRLFNKDQVDARIDLLRLWLDAGMTLGNHTFSHPSLSDIPLAQFEEDVIQGEVVTRRLLQERGKDLLYFRFPYNDTGMPGGEKQAMVEFLKIHHYLITPYTIDNSDWAFNPVYVRSKNVNDQAMMQRTRAAYLDFLDESCDYFERYSQQLLGHEVKQIFLIHDNQLNADCLDELLERFEKRGYSFITLDEALRDNAYQIEDKYEGRAGISWLHRWSLTLGKGLDYRDQPDPPQFIMALQKAK